MILVSKEIVMKKAAIAAAFVGSMILAGVVPAETRVVFVGGHEPARQIRVDTTTPQAPYALTGNQTRPTQRMEPIQVGSRTVGYRVVNVNP
jgi:hypothetical protein